MAKKGARRDRQYGMTAKQSQQKAPVVREGVTPQLRGQALHTLRNLRLRFREVSQRIATKMQAENPALVDSVIASGELDASSVSEDIQKDLEEARRIKIGICQLATALGLPADLKDDPEITMSLIASALDGQHRSKKGRR